MKEPVQKKEIILQNELAFANAIGAAVFEKPRVSFWMVFIPILFLYFIWRMQRFKKDRMKFNEDFMITRRFAMNIAAETLAGEVRPDMDETARNSGLPDPLQKPYASWVKALVDYYLDLLAAEGDNFESLVRAAYGNRAGYLLTIDRLSTVEKAFYSALKPHLEATEGAADIIAAIESQSRFLRRELADQIYR